GVRIRGGEAERPGDEFAAIAVELIRDAEAPFAVGVQAVESAQARERPRGDVQKRIDAGDRARLIVVGHDHVRRGEEAVLLPQSHGGAGGNVDEVDVQVAGEGVEQVDRDLDFADLRGRAGDDLRVGAD